MNIILDRNVFLAPIAKLASITEKKSLMPILSNLLIEFGTENTKIFSTYVENLSAVERLKEHSNIILKKIQLFLLINFVTYNKAEPFLLHM